MVKKPIDYRYIAKIDPVSYKVQAPG
jgi:hypothetical protein